ncbi:MAG: HAD family hydrolase [Eubacteriales bacterium]|nr:HAD family hydrolase [Eubacteriales bacterium]
MKTWLFDFDGTLVDSMPTYVGVMLRILDEHGVSYGEDIVKIITPLGYKGTAEYFVRLGMRRSVEEIVAQMTEYAAYEYAHRVQAKRNVAEALRQLKERGDGLHVLTASPHSMLDPCLKRLGLFELFGCVWSCEDFGTTKSDPEIYRMAAERLGRPIGDIWFLDDNYNADKTAKQAGMKVCGVYDASSAEYEGEIRALADAYIYDFSELLAL